MNPQDVEDRHLPFPERIKHHPDLRDDRPCLCHLQRGTVKDKIVLHIDD
jgi:hypothetical protein